MIPEFVGRLPVFASLRALSREEMMAILTKPRNALIRQYQELFAMEDVELTFTTDAIEALADKAINKGTGARGLRSILENLMLNLMFEMPSREDIRACTVDAAVVNELRPPHLVLGDESRSRKTA